MLILPVEIEKYARSDFRDARALYDNYLDVHRRMRERVEPPQDVIRRNVRAITTKPYRPEGYPPDPPKPVLRGKPGENAGRGRIRYIARAVAHVRGVPISDMVSDRRWKDIVHARWLCWSAIKEIANYSYPAIGKALPGREFDHTTVLYGINCLGNLMRSDSALGRDLAYDRSVIVSLSVDDITTAGLRLLPEIASLASSPDH